VQLHGQPVLFIPGHAGSSHQVRSIASSATRQAFSAPSVPALPGVRAADFFALEFNEDFSALHGPTLAAQRECARAAAAYILALYPAGTRLVLLGHSMGGVVAASLLPHANVSALITVATPHTLPPARFDRRIAALYAHNAAVLESDPTPIVSVCGGATDTLVPSESCVLPGHPTGVDAPFRRTVFASALEGAWTGVGHLAIVWCHQVRWRVARAILELSASPSAPVREAALDKWLADGSRLPPPPEPKTISLGADTIVTGPTLNVDKPATPKTYLLPMPATPHHFTLLVSSSAIPPLAPHHVGRLRVSVLLCTSLEHCTPLKPDTHRLLPRPAPGKPFPVPDEGADESEGVVLLEAAVPANSTAAYIAVRIDAADGTGAIATGFSPLEAHTIPGPSGMHAAVAWAAMLTRSITLDLDPTALSTHIHLPSLLAHTLLVYRAIPHFVDASACTDTTSALLHPLLTLQSPHEAHHHPLHPSFPPALLHAHAGGPYLPSPVRGLNITVHGSAPSACRPTHLELTLDAWATVGRWGARLWPSLAASGVAFAALAFFTLLSTTPAGTPAPALAGTLHSLTTCRLGPLMLGALGTALLPLPPTLALGTAGHPLFAPLAPLVVFCGAGLLVLSSYLLKALLTTYGALLACVSRRGSIPAQPEKRRSARAALLSTGLICAVVFLFVPWQVAFLGCWLLHFHSTAAARAVPKGDTHVHEHALLLLTWLLPLATPVLAVWARTLVTAGYTTPFDGDHNVLYALPFLILVDSLSSPTGATALLTKHSSVLFFGLGLSSLTSTCRRERVSARWGFAVMAGVCFMFGAWRMYLIFDLAALSTGLLVIYRLLPNYLA
jgi:glycosylphosphatidylinositol deacylase